MATTLPHRNSQQSSTLLHPASTNNTIHPRRSPTTSPTPSRQSSYFGSVRLSEDGEERDSVAVDRPLLNNNDYPPAQGVGYRSEGWMEKLENLKTALVGSDYKQWLHKNAGLLLIASSQLFFAR